MYRNCVLTVGLAAGLFGLASCGPKDNGHSTTPPVGAGNGPGPSTTGDTNPRATPPPKTARRAPPQPPRTTPAGVQCPPAGAGLAAMIWPTATAHLRRYINETSLDKIVNTKATPVEVCGARGQIAWLLRARCPGGGAPFTQGHAAHRSRVGSVGAGGRCGEIIDLYKVPCPGKTYSIFMSFYHCMPGQRFP